MSLIKLIQDSSLTTIQNIGKDGIKKGLAELDSSGKNGFHIAAENGENNILEFLLNEELEISKILSTKDKVNQWTPLIFALRNQNISKKNIDMLVAKGGLEVGTDTEGNTLAHHIASCENDAFILEVWSKTKADWAVANKKGDTPLSILLAKKKKNLILKMAGKDLDFIKGLLTNEKLIENAIRNSHSLPEYYDTLNKLGLRLPEISAERISSMYREAHNLMKAADFLANPIGYNRKKYGGKVFSLFLTMLLVFLQPWLQGYYYIWIGGPMEIPKVEPKILKATNPSKIFCENRQFFTDKCINDGKIYDNFLVDQKTIDKYIQMDNQNKPSAPGREQFFNPNNPHNFPPPPQQESREMPGGFQGFPSWRQGQEFGDPRDGPHPGQFGMPPGQHQGFPNQGFPQGGPPPGFNPGMGNRGPPPNQGFPQGFPQGGPQGGPQHNPSFRQGMPPQGGNPNQFRGPNPNQGGNPNMKNPGNQRQAPPTQGNRGPPPSHQSWKGKN